MSDYHWHLSKQVAEKLLSIRSMRIRRNFVDFFNILADEPDFEDDDWFENSEGIRFYVRPFNQWAITYQVDHAVKRVNIIFIEP